MASLEDIKTIGVIGAGQMGNGIAHVIALADYDVDCLTYRQRRSTRRLA
jgi:3-hydroxybutyryl-CoA dehydrogenase